LKWTETTDGIVFGLVEFDDPLSLQTINDYVDMHLVSSVVIKHKYYNTLRKVNKINKHFVYLIMHLQTPIFQYSIIKIRNFTFENKLRLNMW